MCDVKKYIPCPNLDDGLTKPPFKLKHMSNYIPWFYIDVITIHALYSMLVWLI